MRGASGEIVETRFWALQHPHRHPILVVCPASVKYNWQNEIRKWSGESVQVIEGRTPYDLHSTNWYIINYDIIDAWKVQLNARKPQILIADEAHYLKTHNSQRSKAVRKLSHFIPHVILLTGTPMLNRPIEFWHLLHLVDPDTWSSRWWYAKLYCDARKKRIRVRGGGYRSVWDLSGASNLADLHERIQPKLIRRTKDLVLTELPEKTRSVIPVRINMGQYITFYQYTQEALEREENPAAMAVLIEKLKQQVAELKLRTAFEWISNFIEEEKLVLFVTHRDIAKSLKEKFRKKAVVLTGDTPSGQRQAAVERFQNSPNCRLFIGNLQAAGVGITLTAASNAAFLELGWTPGEHLQAESRCHRIGTRYPVNIWYLLAPNTIDDYIFQKLDAKRKVIERVLAGDVSENGFDKQDMVRDVAEFIKGGAAPWTA